MVNSPDVSLQVAKTHEPHWQFDLRKKMGCVGSCDTIREGELL